MSGRHLLAFLALPALVACSMDRDEFIEKLATVSCEKSEECAPEDFGATFDDVEECTNFYVAFFDLLPDEEDGCNYDEKSAKACLNEAKDATCDEYADYEADSVCDEVFTGDGCTIEYDDTGS